MIRHGHVGFYLLIVLVGLASAYWLTDPVQAVSLYGTLILALLYLLYRHLQHDFRTSLHQAVQAESSRQINHQALHDWLSPKQPLIPSSSWSLAPDAIRLYLEHIQDNQPQTIVECGSGQSTIWAALLLQHLHRDNCHIHALESDPVFAEQTRQLLRQHHVQDRATVHDCPLVEQPCQGESRRWYDLSNLPDDLKVQLVLVDGPPSLGTDARWPAPHLLAPYLNSTCDLLLDDAARPGEQLVLKRWADDFPKSSQTDFETIRGLSRCRL